MSTYELDLPKKGFCVPEPNYVTLISETQAKIKY